MIRGTTPTLVFTLPFDVSVIKSAWITFSQNGCEVLTVEGDRCEMTDTKMTVTLSQDETLLFTENCYAEIQIRVLTTYDTSLASDVMRTPVQRVLKGGVIQ